MRFDAPVREAAVVWVNGRRAGSVWSAPYRLDVTPLLKAGTNTIRVEVANTSINMLAGRPPRDYSEIHKKFGARFAPQDTENLQPVLSRLPGGVRLTQ